jgi:hypothetical protein
LTDAQLRSGAYIDRGDSARQADDIITRPLTLPLVPPPAEQALPTYQPPYESKPYFERHIVLSDLHYRTYIQRDYDPDAREWIKTVKTAHDPAALAVAEQFMRDWQPTHIHYAGDLLDMHQISRFEKEPGDSEDIEQDMLGVRAIIKRHRRMLPHATMYYEMGNHEARWERYLRQNAVELRWLTSLTWYELLDARDTGMEIYPWRHRVEVLPGVLEVTHGDKARATSGATGIVMLNMGVSGVSGHTHRLGMVYSTNRRGTTCWAENGSLCRLDPEYLISPNWQQGCFSYRPVANSKRPHSLRGASLPGAT